MGVTLQHLSLVQTLNNHTPGMQVRPGPFSCSLWSPADVSWEFLHPLWGSQAALCYSSLCSPTGTSEEIPALRTSAHRFLRPKSYFQGDVILKLKYLIIFNQLRQKWWSTGMWGALHTSKMKCMQVAGVYIAQRRWHQHHESRDVLQRSNRQHCCRIKCTMSLKGTRIFIHCKLDTGTQARLEKTQFSV